MSLAMSLILLAAMFSTLPTTHADTGFIYHTCEKTKNTTMCVAVLRDDPESAKTSTAHDLASIALQIALNTADHNGAVIGDLAKKSQGTPQGDALAVYHKAYVGAAMDLDIFGRNDFDGGDYAGTSNSLSVAKGASDACENAFEGIGKIPPLPPLIS
ncbi:pectinesterase inhibitor-like [Lolium perenne]|uniref:pectinesterase inhibitor-like n=1 Tax=Lolium perenne TaxID=4522 RepID=UPI003A99066B